MEHTRDELATDADVITYVDPHTVEYRGRLYALIGDAKPEPQVEPEITVGRRSQAFYAYFFRAVLHQPYPRIARWLGYPSWSEARREAKAIARERGQEIDSLPFGEVVELPEEPIMRLVRAVSRRFGGVV